MVVGVREGGTVAKALEQERVAKASPVTYEIDDHVAGDLPNVKQEDVIAYAAAHVIGSRSAIEPIVSSEAKELIIASQPAQDVG